ncbi:porin [bacterium 19PA01SH03]|uniref:Porin n=1 Tax=bacterium 19PA01SH03 TaxID=2920705 RepID=A0AAU6SPH5_UNCXX
MRVLVSRKSALPLALSAVFLALSASGHAARVYTADNGDYMDVFGEVGVGGYFGNKAKFNQFNADESFIDDSFATLGAKGQVGGIHYRLELDYLRENWPGGNGEMVTEVDKVWLGYRISPQHNIEIGLNDTAFDDYDAFGDLTIEGGAETKEAGDQSRTIKYEGHYFDLIRVGVSYSYRAESSSGTPLGNTVNGYVGYFSDPLSVVFGAEKRNGSGGEARVGEKTLYGIGLRYAITSDILLGINGFIEYQDEAQRRTLIKEAVGDQPAVYQFNDYQELKNHGGLVSLQYSLTPQWDLIGSVNYEEYQKWDKFDEFWDGDVDRWDSWGKRRTWQTVGVRYKPTRSSVIEIEANIDDSHYRSYAKATVFF